MKKTLILTAALMALLLAARAQNVHYGEYFELNSTLNASQSHEYTASDYIDLNPGFESNPNVNKSTTLQLDPYGIYPPTAGVTGGPAYNCTGVVGTIGGTVDVGPMGAAVYSIPIELPAGINGMQPSLAITYNSQAGNGLLGWGWDLTGLSLIERTGKTRYHDGESGPVTLSDETDRYMLDGKRLIAVADYTDSVEYKTEQDEMSKIMAYYIYEQVGGTFGYGTIKILDHFKVWRSNGIILEYGTSYDTKINLQESSNVCCWLLRQMTDRSGNFIIYHYNTNSLGYRLSSIDYTGNSSLSPAITPLFRIMFSYNTRLDTDLIIIGQKKLRCSDLLESISICKKDSGNQYVELNRYDFDYYNANRSTGCFYTRLQEISYSRGQECFNPTIIKWTQQTGYYGALLSKNFNTIDHNNAFYNSVKFPGDFNGDGYTDVIVTRANNNYRYTWAEVYLNQGGDNTINFEYVTGFNLNDSVDWIHVADFNGDGKDDFVITDREKRSWPWRDLLTMNVYLSHVDNNTLSFTHLPQLGPYKIKRNYNESILIGDFWGNGNDCIIVQASQEDDDHPGQFSYDKAYLFVCSSDETEMTVSQFNDYLPSFRLFTADFDGDGATEIMYLTEDEYRIKKLQETGNTFTYALSSNGFALNDSYDCYLGDFNGDGKTDVLSCHVEGNNEPVWKINLSGSSGLTASEYIIDSFGLDYLGPTHHFSLKKRQLYTYYVQVADFNGDGYDDIKHPVIGDVYDQQFYFCPVVDSGSYAPFSGEKQFHAFHGPHNNTETCLGCFRGKETCDDLGDEELYYFVPILDLYSVSRIIDGHDNKLDLTYDYLMPELGSQNNDAFYLLDRSQENVQYHVSAISIPTKALKRTTTWNVSGTPVSSSYQYGGILYHSQGKGVLGLTTKTTTNSATISINGTEHEDVISTSEQHYNLHVNNSNIYMSPSFVNNYDGNLTLLSETTYNNTAFINTRSENHKVFLPVVTKTTTDEFDPDNAAFLKRSIKVITYNSDGTNGQYNNTICSTKLKNGVTTNQNTTDVGACEFRTMDSTVYYSNNYSTWTINRPHHVYQIQSRNGKPDVEKWRKIVYTAANSYLPSRVDDIPNRVSDQDPLMLQTNYEYYSEGNLRKKIVKAPHGQLGEQQKTYEYEYGPGDQHRLVTNEIVSSGDLSYSTSYSYDDYDRIDTLTGANGLASTYRSDAFGITSWTHNADSTKSCTALRWTQGHPLAPTGASYYRWSRSSDGKQTLTFYHKTGAELRSVTYGLRGEPIFTDRQYDNRGRLSAVSEPYKEGETARWTVYGYDNLDRLTSVTTPDTTCTSTVYDGFRTETTVTTPQGLSQESAVTVNAMGWTVRSDDASGSYVVYDHYADGLMATATVNGNSATTVTASYDNARQRTTLADPDYGTLTTAYDAYGRLKRSVSPKELAAQKETVNFYDGFDRLVKTTDGMENTRIDYTYNETGVTKGMLNEMRFRVQGGADIQRITYSYDTLARPVSATEQRATGNYTTNVEYDARSRISRMVYPTGVTVRYGYQNGYLRCVADNNGQLLWKINDMDARGQLLEAELGNGAVTRHTYDTLMHRLQSIVTTNNLQNLTYDYDKFGNLASRKDNQKNLKETFTYDDMNRLTGITLKRSSGQDLNCAVVYDALGRMTSKQAVTAASNVPQVSTIFSQPTFNASKVHALSTIQSTSDLFLSSAQVVTYTGFDKVRSVRNGNDSIRYAYGYDHQRIRMEERIGTSRTKDYVGSCEYITETGTSGTKTLTYLTGPYGVFAVIEKLNGVQTPHYILKDNLGSWTTITNGSGTVEQQLSYDAWGNLRNPNTWANYTAGDSFDKPMFDRGFTGHEHLVAFGLINMNGRIYDPVISSFLSADRYVQDPSSAMGFNRYAYCMNNPLKFVDPTGWRAGHGGGGYPRSVSGLIQDYLSDPCYVTREQLREAGIYNIEGGYGYAGGGGTMGAHWMDGFGTCHYSSWYILTEGGGFDAGAWAIPASFNSNWVNDSQGYCDFGNMNCVKGESNQNSNSNSATSQGSRGGGGNWGGGRDRVKNPVSNNINTILGYVVTTESTLFGTRSYSLKQLKNQKVLDELGKSLRTTYETRGIVQKGLSGMEVGKVAVGRMTTASNVLGGVGIALVGVDVILNDNIIYPSHVLDVGIGAASIFAGPPGWIIGGSYLLIDLGSYAFSGKPFGQHLNTWCGGVGYDIKTNSFVYKKW